MCDDNAWGHAHATDQQREQLARQLVHDAFNRIAPEIVDAVQLFIAQPLSPRSFYAFELALVALLRSFGAMLLQATIESLEPQDHGQLPRDLYHQCGGYRRRNQKTRNQNIASLFGNIVLWRRGYRSWQSGEEAIFPLERMLGLTESVTPALLSYVGKSISSAGMSQAATIALLKQQCAVIMGVKRLRSCTKVFSDVMSDLRQTHQVDALLELLAQAAQSSGNRKPVLAVGRDGITLREYRHRFSEVATAATVSVYDRAGKRLRTIYLAWPPELGQATMDAMLTELLSELFSRWEGPLPRLAYVTDSGSNEIDYFDKRPTTSGTGK